MKHSGFRGKETKRSWEEENGGVWGREGGWGNLLEIRVSTEDAVPSGHAAVPLLGQAQEPAVYEQLGKMLY